MASDRTPKKIKRLARQGNKVDENWRRNEVILDGKNWRVNGQKLDRYIASKAQNE